MSEKIINQRETIVAIASAIVPQQGSIGIVRLSGQTALDIAQLLFDAPGQQKWESHHILYGFIRHPQTKIVVDEALLLLMLSPRSFTCEDVVEFHCHGGIIPVQQVLQLCIESGARLALPGEFSLRAFLNGRLDLTQAESIAELVSAQSPQMAQIALAGLQGKLASPIKELRATCLDILAEVEARIDFEDDLPPLNEIEVKQKLNQVLEQVSSIIKTADRGELLRSGVKVAIVGKPNVGKSSLLNAWSRSDRAIVTDLPGTTRDVVESQLVVGGIPIQVLDTAGIRETEDTVEQMGVIRSKKVALSADLILFTIDGQMGWTMEDQAIYQELENKSLILIINKIDLGVIDNLNYPPTLSTIVYTAVAKNQGIDELETAILDSIKGGQLTASNTEIAVNQRQASALTRAKIALEQVKETINQELPLDFWSIDLRSAIQALGEVTGEEFTESMLDIIFSRFCIGK